MYKQHSLSPDNQRRKRPWMSNWAVKLREKVPKSEQTKSDMTKHDWHLIMHWWVYFWAADKNIIKKQHDVEGNRKTLCVVLMTINNLSNTKPGEKWIESPIIQKTASLVFLRNGFMNIPTISILLLVFLKYNFPQVLVHARNVMTHNLN